MKIELRSVLKTYGSIRALDHVSLQIEPGQIVSLLGLNGAGKTTLIRCIAGIAAPDQGGIYFDDQEFARGRLDLRRRMHFLPDFPLHFWDQTVFVKYCFDSMALLGSRRLQTLFVACPISGQPDNTGSQ